MPFYKTGKTKNGKQQYRVILNYTLDGKKKQKSKMAYGLTEAKQAEIELQQQLDDSRSGKMTVEDLCLQYLDDKKHDVRQSSLDKSRSILSVNVIPYIGNIAVEDITPRVIQTWKNKVAERNVCLSTKKNAYKELRAMLNHAVKMDIIPGNPIKKVSNFKEIEFVSQNDKIRYYTPAQFLKYMAVAKSHTDTHINQAIYIFFCIAFLTGMRKGEINALRWSDIEGNIIHVRRSVNQKIKGVAVLETAPKNKTSYRDIQMPDALITILQDHKKAQAQSPLWNEEYRVCGGHDVVKDTTLENANAKYAVEAELPHIRIHDFRHSHASFLASEGINIMEISRRLGHSDVKMTWNTYAHLYPKEEERAISILNDIMA